MRGMIDFFDVWTISEEFAFDGPTLSRAIKTTFEIRSTTVQNEPPLALSPEFYDDREKNAQWKAFLNKAKLNRNESHCQRSRKPCVRSSFLSEAVARDEILENELEPGWILDCPRLVGSRLVENGLTIATSAEGFAW